MPRHTFEDRGGVEVKGKVSVLAVDNDLGPEGSISITQEDCYNSLTRICMGDYCYSEVIHPSAALPCIFVISYRFHVHLGCTSISNHSYKVGE